jgi:hypothetical protein
MTFTEFDVEDEAAVVVVVAGGYPLAAPATNTGLAANADTASAAIAKSLRMATVPRF